MGEKCTLRELMQMLISFGTVRLRSARIVEDLKQCTGLTAAKVVEYLEILDIKYIRVDWSGGGRIRGISEILRYELDGLIEPEPVKKESNRVSKPRIPRAPALPNPRECITCHQTKMIVSKGRCNVCRCEKRICATCGQERPIISKGHCWNCYQKNRRKIICIVCGQEKTIAAKDKCINCYHESRKKEACEPEFIHNPT